MGCRSALKVAIGESSQRKVAMKVTGPACLALCLVLLSHITLAGSAAIQRREAYEEAENVSSTQNTTLGEGITSESNTGTIVIICVIIVIASVVIGVAVYCVTSRRHSRMMDKEKKMQMQMMAAHNAGVYQDLTVSVPAYNKPFASPEHERLNAAEDA